MPRLLESSHSFMLFDRRSPLPPLAVCLTPYYRLACPSRAIGTEFSLLPVLVRVYNVLNWKASFILRYSKM